MYTHFPALSQDLKFTTLDICLWPWDINFFLNTCIERKVKKLAPPPKKKLGLKRPWKLKSSKKYANKGTFLDNYWKDIARASKICSSGRLLGNFGREKQKLTKGAYQGNFWAIFGRIWQNFTRYTLLGHLLGSLWKGIARGNKICSSGHFWAVFGKA